MTATAKYAHELEPGDEYAPLEFVISADLNQQYLYGQEDFDPRYLPVEAGGAGLVHPSALLQMAANTRSPSFRLAPGTGSILSEASTEFLRDAAVGAKLTSRWKVTGEYEKRGRHYYAMQVEIVDERGEAILRRILHLTFPRREDR